MKTAVGGVLVFFSALFFGLAWPDQPSERPERLLELMILLPADNEIPGWKRTEKALRASNRKISTGL